MYSQCKPPRPPALLEEARDPRRRLGTVQGLAIPPPSEPKTLAALETELNTLVAAARCEIEGLEREQASLTRRVAHATAAAQRLAAQGLQPTEQIALAQQQLAVSTEAMLEAQQTAVAAREDFLAAPLLLVLENDTHQPLAVTSAGWLGARLCSMRVARLSASERETGIFQTEVPMPNRADWLSAERRTSTVDWPLRDASPRTYKVSVQLALPDQPHAGDSHARALNARAFTNHAMKVEPVVPNGLLRSNAPKPDGTSGSTSDTHPLVWSGMGLSRPCKNSAAVAESLSFSFRRRSNPRKPHGLRYKLSVRTNAAEFSHRLQTPVPHKTTDLPRRYAST